MSERFVFCPRGRRVVVREASGSSVSSGPRHENVGFEIVWVERGIAGFDVGARRIDVAAGACVVIPPAIEHTPRARSTRFHQITLPTDWVHEAAATVGGARPSAIAIRDVLVDHTRAVALDVARGVEETDPGVQAALYALTVALVRPESLDRRVDRRVRRAVECMRARYAERLTIDELAAVSGMSRFAFLRAFRATIGESPYRHLTNVRLEHAAERLRSGRDPVLALALSCGFTDPGRFARAFRARFGCTPRRYRQQTLSS